MSTATIFKILIFSNAGKADTQVDATDVTDYSVELLKNFLSLEAYLRPCLQSMMSNFLRKMLNNQKPVIPTLRIRFTSLNAAKLLQGDILLSATKSPGISGTHFINFGT